MTPHRADLEGKPIPTLRILVLAMAGGLIMVSAVMVFVSRTVAGAASIGQPFLFVAILVVMALGEATTFSLLRRQAVAALRPEAGAPAPPAEVMRRYVRLTIVAAAMAESVGMLGAVFYFLTGEPFVLAAPALALIVLGRCWPSEEKAARLAAPTAL